MARLLDLSTTLSILRCSGAQSEWIVGVQVSCRVKRCGFFFSTEMETQREVRRQNPIVQSLSCNNLTKLKTKMLCEVLLRIDNIQSLLLL